MHTGIIHHFFAFFKAGALLFTSMSCLLFLTYGALKMPCWRTQNSIFCSEGALRFDEMKSMRAISHFMSSPSVLERTEECQKEKDPPTHTHTKQTYYYFKRLFLIMNHEMQKPPPVMLSI